MLGEKFQRQGLASPRLASVADVRRVQRSAFSVRRSAFGVRSAGPSVGVRGEVERFHPTFEGTEVSRVVFHGGPFLFSSPKERGSDRRRCEAVWHHALMQVARHVLTVLLGGGTPENRWFPFGFP